MVWQATNTQHTHPTHITVRIRPSQEEHPGFNFIGLIIGPRGNTQVRRGAAAAPRQQLATRVRSVCETAAGALPRQLQLAKLWYG